ncbi:MAG: hypothetical protein CVT74_01395 [Alphaproteobacteria bacterium HGW-Alphaproteobacteria-13]|jgi:ketosteroid isomerase-like protein|nr:MAG: hypothetical protein CVT74_01395 [Alphaproteobacteria bacterium HGW-Alphaproteobacteria-13]
MSDREALHARIQALEDAADIARLKAAYCAACDADHDGEAVSRLFVPDGRWIARGKFMLEGRDAIRAYFDGIRQSGRIRASSHMIGNPEISVEGDRARGRWHLLMLYEGPNERGERAFFRIIARYDDMFVRAGGAWRFQSLQTSATAHDEYLCGPSRLTP